MVLNQAEEKITKAGGKKTKQKPVAKFKSQK
jgi:hypothetical protein